MMKEKKENLLRLTGGENLREVREKVLEARSSGGLSGILFRSFPRRDVLRFMISTMEGAVVAGDFWSSTEEVYLFHPEDGEPVHVGYLVVS